MLLDLQSVVLIPILADWLDVQSLAYLDSAMCCSSTRSEFLKLICGCNFRHQGQRNRSVMDGELNWLILRSIKVKCVSLWELENKRLNNEYIQYFSNCKAFEEVRTHCNPNFKYLIDHCFQEIGYLTLFIARKCDDETIMGIKCLENIVGLTILDISGQSLLTDEVCNYIVKHCPDLISINCSECTAMTSKAAEIFSNGLPLLTELVSNSTLIDSNLITITENYPQLTHLDANFCENISDSAIITLTASCTLLKFINFKECKHISDASMTKIAQNCKIWKKSL